MGATAPLRCELFVNYFTVYLTGRRSVTDVTGVAIPPDFSSRYQEVSLLTGGFPRQCAHWLGMTVLLFVQFFFSETAPYLDSTP